MKERRASNRHEDQSLLEFSTTAEPPLRAQLSDVSERGARLWSARPLRTGQILKCRLSVEGRQHLVRLGVVWTRKASDGINAGLRYLPVEYGSEALWMNFWNREAQKAMQTEAAC